MYTRIMLLPEVRHRRCLVVTTPALLTRISSAMSNLMITFLGSRGYPIGG